LDLLSAGGVLGFKEALAPFGLDPSEPSFWDDSINAHLGSLMEEAEALSKKLGYTE
jgi:oligoendopeptidase F